MVAQVDLNFKRDEFNTNTSKFRIIRRLGGISKFEIIRRGALQNLYNSRLFRHQFADCQGRKSSFIFSFLQRAQTLLDREKGNGGSWADIAGLGTGGDTQEGTHSRRKKGREGR